MIRAPLLRVDTADEMVHVHFNDHQQGTRVTLPLRTLRSCAPADDDPLRLELHYDGALVAIKDVSDRARLWHYRRLARHVFALPPGRARSSHASLYAAMIDSELDQVRDPLVVDQLTQLALSLLEAAIDHPGGEESDDGDDLPF